MRITNPGQFGNIEGERGKGSAEERTFELGFQKGRRVQQVEDGAFPRGSNIAMKVLVYIYNRILLIHKKE